MIIAKPVRFVAACNSCLFVGFLPDGGNVFECKGRILIVDSDGSDNYSSMTLDFCIDFLPEGSRLHQAAILYLEQGTTPMDSVSEVTTASNRSKEMTETIVRRTVTTVEYVEITRTASAAPVIDVSPVSAAIPAAPVYVIDGQVRYTSKAGRTATYAIKWVGMAKDGVTQRLGLRLPGKRDLFFVNVDRNVSPA